MEVTTSGGGFSSKWRVLYRSFPGLDPFARSLVARQRIRARADLLDVAAHQADDERAGQHDSKQPLKHREESRKTGWCDVSVSDCREGQAREIEGVQEGFDVLPIAFQLAE